MPDVEIASLRSNSLIGALLQNHIIFDFATDYYYTNKLDAPADFDLTDETYKAFVDHVGKSGFSFETATETALQKALAEREDMVFNEAVEADFKALLADLQKSKIRALQTYSAEISRELEDEIVKRYFYREGLYERYLAKDDAILAARELLADASKYQSILR